MDVEGVGLLEVRHHLPSAYRSPYTKRDVATHHPAGEPEVRNPHNVVGVEMRKKQTIDLFDFDLVQSHGYATAAIEEQVRSPGLYQNAWPEAGDRGPRIPRAQQRHLEESLSGNGRSESDRQNVCQHPASKACKLHCNLL